MRGEVTCSGAAKAATGTGSAAWAQMQASPNAAATTAMLHCFTRFPKPPPPAGRPSIRSAPVRWRGGAPPMAVGGAADRHSIFPAAFGIIDANLTTMGRRSTLLPFTGDRDVIG